MNTGIKRMMRTAILAAVTVVFVTGVAWSAEDVRNGQTVSGLRGRPGSEYYYKIAVPKGTEQLVFRTWGGQGQADLYARYGAQPTPKAFQYKSATGGTGEQIAIKSPRPGWWYVAVQGDHYRGVSFRASYVPPVRPVPPRPVPGTVVRPPRRVITLRNGVPVHGVRGGLGAQALFEIVVPKGADRLRVATSGGTGNCDLYLSHGTIPTTRQFNYRATGAGTHEAINVGRVRPGKWYVLVYGARPFSGVTVVASYQAGSDAGQGKIVLTSPTGGERWRAGGSYWVTWRAHRSVERVQIQYSLDDGRTWRVGNWPRHLRASTGRFEVRLPPDFVTDRARIRIVDVRNASVHDTSRRFRVLPAGLDHGRRDDDVRGRDRYEPDNNRNRARVIATDKLQTHTIWPKDDEDWLAFATHSPGKYVVRFTGVTETLQGQLWYRDWRGREEKGDKFKISRPGGEISIQVMSNVRAVKLEVRAKDDDETGSYTIGVTRTPSWYDWYGWGVWW